MLRLYHDKFQFHWKNHPTIFEFIPRFESDSLPPIWFYHDAKYYPMDKIKEFFPYFFASLRSLLYLCRKFEGHFNCLSNQFIFNKITDL
jgi:hypothetical protein